MSCVNAGPVAGLSGVQVPRIRLEPAAVDVQDGDDAAKLAGDYGLEPDPWQHDVLRGWLARRGDGKWAATRCGLAVPRQNGKNALLEMRELFGMVFLGEKFLHTAHEVKTSRKAFDRLLGFFDNEREFPELAALVEDIRRAPQQGIYLENGGSVEFIARSKSSGRGFTVDVIVMDEAQELSDEVLAALRPTVSAAPLGNPQLIFAGTPPSPSMNGEVFTRVRAVAKKGEDARLRWDEWSCELDADAASDEAVAVSNPAVGVRLLWETITDERADMDDETFARERLGEWLEMDGGASLVAGWVATEDEQSQVEVMGAFGVEVSLDRAWTSIAVAGANGDRTHLELVDRRGGTGWVVDRCKQLERDHGHAVFVIDGGGPAANLIPEFEAAGLWLVVADTRAVTTAAADLVDAVTQRTVSHGPQRELELAVAGAKRRPLGDGVWAFGRKASTVDITPLVAVTLALWGFTGQQAFGPDDVYVGSF
jgi:hypothetical protein